MTQICIHKNKPSACSLSASSSQLSTGGLLGLVSDNGASVVGLDSEWKKGCSGLFQSETYIVCNAL